MAELVHRNIGANITEEEYDLYLNQLDTFGAWFDTTIMSLSDGDAIMILPYGSSGPGYRDIPPR